MNFNFNTIQNAALTAWNWGAEQAIFLGNTTVQLGESAIELITPGLTFISQKIQGIWSAALPYLGIVRDFLTSNLGIATMLLGGTIICMSLARQAKNTPIAAAWMIAGVASAIASGALLVGANILSPNLPLVGFRPL